MYYNQRRKNLETILKRFGKVPIIVSIFSIFCFLYDFGFDHGLFEKNVLTITYLSSSIIGAIAIVVRYFFKQNRPRIKSVPIDILFFIYLSTVAFQHLGFNIFQLFFFRHIVWLYIAIFLVFFREIFAIKFEFWRAVVNPAQLFVISFFAIIILGSIILLLPNATVADISLIDAIFTSTSAVCVTGLVVVDTGSFFTDFGQIVIVLLIQIGGLGIMTFASYFSYFFRGGSSYQNQLILRDMTNTEKISEVFSVLKKIILVTLIIEGIGALLLFQSLDIEVIPSFVDRLFFAIFHSISGFCNAGFSTLPNSFYQDAFQFNYPLHLILAFLIILGGLGFPIVFNLLKFSKSKVKTYLLFLFRRKHKITLPRLININTRIVLITTLILTVFGTIAFLILEYSNTLSNHSFFGKIITAFFGAVTARTAGFNTVDTGALGVHTILIVMFLMWVGASPASTGGGIKTSTLALAILNTISIVKGKTRLELYNREIPVASTNRAFAIIVLSIIVISISILFISFFDADNGLLNISFECVSAYGTVGLSRGITANLSSASKVILILTMFVGRVSMLTLLIAFYKKVSSEAYRYPTENILIN